MAKTKVLVYSIVRNESQFIDRYYEQLKDMVKTFSDHEFYISIYENDSTDDTFEKLMSKDWSIFKDFHLETEILGTKAYGAVKVTDRVKNLSIARNKAIEAKNFLQIVDYVMMIESDMAFDMDAMRKVLEFKKLEPNFDIVSMLTKRGEELYDSWATRKEYKFESHQHAKSFDFTSKPYDKYYSTSNGVCLYRAQPFREGVRYGYINTKTRQSDCDTVVVCQYFHAKGYENIYIIHTALAHHEHF